MTTTSPATTSPLRMPRDSVVLALENLRRPLELQDAGVDARRLHDAAVEREVALEHGEAAVLRERVFELADDALRAILVEFVPSARPG